MRSIRSPRTSSALLLLLLCTATGLHAQAPAASAPVSDRAARDAHNPMRVILEAGRLKVRVKQEAAEAPAAAPRKDTAVKAKPGAVPEVARTAPAVPKPAVPAVAEPAPAAPAVATPASLPIAAPETRSALAAPTASPAALPPPAAPARPPAPLKNIRLVEPELPASALRRLRGEVEVVVGFTVNPDGSVSDVVIRSSPNQALDGPVVDAVRQWRYAPVEQPRQHAVQLVLRGDR